MLLLEPLESRRLLSHYAMTDLADFHGRAMNSWGLVAGLDAAGHPATWYRGTITDLPTPDGFKIAVPNAVNDWGQVAGSGLVGGSLDTLFWDSQGVIDLGPGQAFALNNLSQAAGTANNLAALWCPNQPVATFGNPSSQAFAINDAGQVTGEDNGRTFRRTGGSLQDLSMPTADGLDSLGAGINAAGDIAGAELHSDSRAEAAVWYADGHAITLAVPDGWVQSFGSGINDRGQVVGLIQGNSADVRDAFIWDAAHGVRDLNDLTDTQGFTLYGAYTVTDRGVIFGAARPPDGGPLHSVILTPVHERGQPTTTDLGWALSLLLQKHG